MGTGITVKCNNCTYQQSFTLGVGMMYSDLHAVLSVIKEPRIRVAIKEILDAHPSAKQDFEHTVYTCLKCHTFHERLYVRLSEEGALLYQVEYHCPRCGTILKQISEKSIIKQPCPKCGEKSLRFDEELLWD